MNDTAVLTVGESLVDIVLDSSGGSTEHPGGSPLNVAVALARLGHDSQLATRIGGDDRGRTVAAHLHDSGVRLTPGSVVAGERTSTALARLGADGSATYEFDLLWDLADTSSLPAVDAVHTGSLGAVLSPGADRAVEVVTALRESATVSYDPNIRPTLMGDADTVRPRVEQMMDLADVVKASQEDLAWLYPGADPEQVLQELVGRGVPVAIMTQGVEGALAYCTEGRAFAPPVATEVADTVGAGDTFMAGFLDGLGDLDLLGDGRREKLRRIGRSRLSAALTRATECAAVAVSRPGADPPWARELAPAPFQD